jgi:NAD(P)-dependent dehydrogenase (short-subunit alcohol dehydrogenase family)
MTGYLDSRAGLAGRTAAVIGGAYGIGWAVTLALAGAGVNLVIGDADADALETTCSEATAIGQRVITHHCDVAKESDVAGFYELVERETEILDIVVNLAGGVRMSKLLDKTPEEEAADIRRNFGYVVQSYRLALPLIRRSGRGGSIVSFTTIEAHRGAAGVAVYAGAKAATTNFTRAMAVELGAEGIRCNCIVPDTTISRGNMRALPEDMLARIRALPEAVRPRGYEMYVPMKRPPAEDDLANAVLYLASDLAAMVTGIDLHVDGGTKASSGFLEWPFGDGHVPTPLAGTLERLFVEK